MDLGALMQRKQHICFIIVLCYGLSSCASLDLIHDPHTGLISRDQVTKFVKSVRCEIITYLEANRRRKQYYFDLSESLFGFVSLDLAVFDTLGVLGGDAGVDRVTTINSIDNFTWHLGPIINSQNTYDMTIGFLIPQNAKLSSVNSDDQVSCFSPPLPDDFEGLAQGRYKTIERFTRILVNGTQPLAEWLLGIDTEMSPNVEASRIGEVSYPSQMTYTFTVQVTAGLNAKYSLVNPVWNTLSPGGTVSTQQTSKLQFTLNGPDAMLLVGAQTGTAVIGGTGGPTYEPIPGTAPTLTKTTKSLVPAPPGPPTVAPPSGSGNRLPTGIKQSQPQRGLPQGHLIYPLPLVPLGGFR
jgi:hypothetical protein